MYTTAKAGNGNDARGTYTILEGTCQLVHAVITVCGGERLEPFYIREMARWRGCRKKSLDNAIRYPKDHSNLRDTVA